MVAGCGNKCIKYTFFLFNFLFFLFGALILALAIWVRFDSEFQQRLDDILTDTQFSNVELDKIYLALYVMGAIGILLFTTGFLGCCGACCESLCVLGLFFSVVLALFCLQIATGIFVYVKQDTIKEDFADWYKNTLTPVQLDLVNEQLSCCGARGCSEFLDQAPDSCQCSTSNEGCAYKLYKMVQANLFIIGIAGISLLAVELLAMIFSCVLCGAMRQDYDYY